MKHTDLRNLLIFSVAILLGMALAACGGGKYHGELLRAESILDSLPDSAREILKAIPRDTIDTREDLALRDLIAAEVQYKLYEDGPTGADTLAAAEETFRSSGDDKRLMHTLFQKAVRQFHAVNYSESLVSALEALEIAEELQDYRYLGYSIRHLGDIYNHNYAFAEALPLIRQSITYFDKAGMSSHKMFAWVDVAIDLSNLGYYEESLRTSDSILAVANPSDKTLLSYVYENRIRPNLKLGRIEEANRCIDLMNLYDRDADYHNPTLPILVAIKSGQLEKARIQIDSLKECKSSKLSKSDISNIECDYYSAIGDTATAFTLCDETYRLDSYSLMKLTQLGITGSQKGSSQMLSSAKTLDNIKKTRLVEIIVLMTVLLSLLTASILLWRKRRLTVNTLREKESRIEILSRALDDSNKLLYEKDSYIESLSSSDKATENADCKETEKLRKELRTLFHGQFQTINLMCQDYYSKKDASSNVKLSLINDIEKHIQTLCSKDNIKEIERMLNVYYNSVASKLREALPDLKTQDRVMLLLSMTGLSTKAICIVCGIEDKGYLYNRRKRLKVKIAQSGSTYSEEILEMLA